MHFNGRTKAPLGQFVVHEDLCELCGLCGLIVGLRPKAALGLSWFLLIIGSGRRPGWVQSVFHPWLLELPEFAVIRAFSRSVDFNSSDLPV